MANAEVDTENWVLFKMYQNTVQSGNKGVRPSLGDGLGLRGYHWTGIYDH